MASSAWININPGSINPAAQAIGGRTPAPMAVSSSSDNSAAGSGTASISANDFLTLLVAEMKNQDPTENQDPNEYINQLVQVNSLQQLISINGVLTNALGSSSQSSGGAQATETEQRSGSAASIAGTLLPSTSTAAATASHAPFTGYTTGNLGIQATNPSALGIAQALDGTRPPAGPATAGTLR